MITVVYHIQYMAGPQLYKVISTIVFVGPMGPKLGPRVSAYKVSAGKSQLIKLSDDTSLSFNI